ncbi:hypothetical protein SDC9_111445 [bioreactor metagenome]|uniref:Uncharacterized protein n=1 Tax=bioreactor metagenome TaxID=1076179 RepID=A0A645BHH6_9ZZZZ
MPLELLRRLTTSELPITLRNYRDVDKLRVLRAACMVHADISGDGERSEAVVHEVTQYGQIAASINEDPAN